MKTAKLTDMKYLACAALLLLVACAAPQDAPSATKPAVVTDTVTPAPRDLAAAITAPPPATGKEAVAGAVDANCKTDADCVVKDVGNCCGYYPQCVNAGSPTFPEQVKAQCAKDGMAGICGYPTITGCSCVAGKCAAQATASAS